MMEILVAAALLSVVGLMAMTLMSGTTIQFARNISINQSGEQSRRIMARVMRELETAVDTPELINLQSSPLSLVQYTAGSYARGIRFHQLVGAGYQIIGPEGASVPFGPILLKYTSSTATTAQLRFFRNSDIPKVNDRLLVLSGNAAALGETVSSGTSPGQKPGRRITAVSSATLPTSDSVSVDVTVNLSSAFGRQILLNNRCIVVREVAILAVDTGGRRELRYYPATSNLSDYQVLSTSLDPNPQERDTGGNIIQPFRVQPPTSSPSAPPMVSLSLPILVSDYRATLLRIKPQDEFNTYMQTTSRVTLRNYVID